MIIVADTSPLNYLIQLGCETVLADLYERILIPRAVADELSHPEAPEAVHTWLTQ